MTDRALAGGTPPRDLFRSNENSRDLGRRSDHQQDVSAEVSETSAQDPVYRPVAVTLPRVKGGAGAAMDAQEYVPRDLRPMVHPSPKRQYRNVGRIAVSCVWRLAGSDNMELRACEFLITHLL